MFYVYIVLAIIFYFLYQKWLTFNEFVKRVDKLPGPKALPLIGNTLDFLRAPKLDPQLLFDQWNKQYNGFYRVWMAVEPIVRIEKPEHLEELIKSSKQIEKAVNYDFLKSWLGEGLLIAKGEKWFQHRRLITPTFHFTILENFVTIFGENSNIFVQKLDELAKEQKPFELFPLITKCALDIICETAMGVKINAQVSSSNREYVDAIKGLSKTFMHRFTKPWYRYDATFKRTQLGRDSARYIDILHGFTKKVIAERKQSKSNKTQENVDDDFGKKKRMAFLDLLLETEFSDQDIREEVDTFMFEGHDTTTAGMFWTLSVLGTLTDVQEKVYEELEGIFGDDRTRIPEISDLNEMKYLDRVVKESLRMFPPVPNFGRKLNEDFEIDGYVIPKDTTVGVGVSLIHRDEKYFPDPEKFYPDRFLPENSANRHPFAFIPFSAGPRNCIGQKFAMYEEKTVISSIVRNFKFKCCTNFKDIKSIQELVLRPSDIVFFTFEKRQ